MTNDVEMQKLLGRIRERRASINTYVRKNRPLGNRLANISIVSSAVAAALTAGPAAGGVTFAKAVQNGLGLAESSSVWQMLCFSTVIVSLVAAISTNLSKSNDLTVRISVAEACSADLEGLQTLVEFGELPVKDAATTYRQLVAQVPFIEGDLPADANAYSNDAVELARRLAFILPGMAIVFAGLVLLITIVGLFVGLSRGAAAAPSSQPPPLSTTSDASPAPSVPVPTVAAILPVGEGPEAVAITPSGHYAYVTNSRGGSLSVIDTTTHAITASVTINTGPPRYISFTPDGRHAYVSVYTDDGLVNAVLVVNTAANAVTASIPVGGHPYALAATPDGRKVYVPNHDNATLSVIDTATNTVTVTIPVAPNPHSVTFSADGRSAYVANHESNVVTVLDLATNTVTATIPVGRSPHNLALTPNGQRLYVVNYNGNNVSVINTATNTVATTISVGLNPQSVVFAPDGRHAYVVNNGDNTVSVIDSGTNQLTATVPVDGTSPTTMAIPPDGRYAYVTNNDSNTVSILNIGSQ